MRATVEADDERRRALSRLKKDEDRKSCRPKNGGAPATRRRQCAALRRKRIKANQSESKQNKAISAHERHKKRAIVPEIKADQSKSK
jgi:hypothetical protein